MSFYTWYVRNYSAHSNVIKSFKIQVRNSLSEHTENYEFPLIFKYFVGITIYLVEVIYGTDEINLSLSLSMFNANSNIYYGDNENKLGKYEYFDKNIKNTEITTNIAMMLKKENVLRLYIKYCKHLLKWTGG